MTANLDMTKGKAAMAYTGEVPWHGLGAKLDGKSSIEQWKKAAGMDWQLIESPVFGEVGKKKVQVEGMKTLIRDDSNTALSIVSNRYHVVQPGEAIEFFRDLVKDSGIKLETAGCLKGGRRYWALANTSLEASIAKEDKLKAYVLLTSSCDGSLATKACFTSVRVVCQNTLSMSLAKGSHKNMVSVRHSMAFDPKKTKIQLGLAKETFDNFIETAKKLAGRKVSQKEAEQFFMDLCMTKDEIATLDRSKTKELPGLAGNLMLSYLQSPGHDLVTAKGTAWGLVNATTFYYDHARQTRSSGSRLNRAWFGDGNRMKQEAMAKALEMV